MRNRFMFVLAATFGALSIYCAQSAIDPERDARADGSSGGSSGGAACCDTTPKWSKLAEGKLTITSDKFTEGDPVDVSAFHEISILSRCEKGNIHLSWGPQGSGFFSDRTGLGQTDRRPVVAPFVRPVGSVSSGTASCDYVIMGIK